MRNKPVQASLITFGEMQNADRTCNLLLLDMLWF